MLDAAKNEVGQIVRIAPNALSSFDALIELRIEAKEAGNMTFNDAEITLKYLPYEV